MSAKGQPRFRKFVPTDVALDIVQAMDHPGLFGRWFEGPSWDTWRVILRAAFHLPMSKNEIAIFHTIAGGRAPPKKRVKELWIIAGRRAGKDSAASLIAAYTAALFQAGFDRLRPGERALVQLLACDRDQAKVVFGYIRSFFEFLPPLANMIVRQTSSS